MNKPIILNSGHYRVAIPAHANLAKVARWMRVCGYQLKFGKGFFQNTSNGVVTIRHQNGFFLKESHGNGDV